MSELRVPDIPLPRPFLRVLSDEIVTREDVDKVRKTMQQTIDLLQIELKRERELVKKLEKSGEVLNEILSSPDFRALSMKSAAATEIGAAAVAGGGLVEEAPVEYVDVVEVELTEDKISQFDAGGNVTE